MIDRNAEDETRLAQTASLGSHLDRIEAEETSRAIRLLLAHPLLTADAGRLPDFWKVIALVRIHQILRPGGGLCRWDVVYSFDPALAEDRIEAWCCTGNTTADDGWSRGELEEHVRDEHSTSSLLLEPIMQRSGFTIEDAEYSDDGIFGKYVLQ
ncbi:MAG TPA: hypothetical protein VFQ77_21960 [Pseudonocardiaceae bacterium]|jgi:hypothetical protein|nr:hypothetical protein [Pseudonocardiaceae bacterium]